MDKIDEISHDGLRSLGKGRSGRRSRRSRRRL